MNAESLKVSPVPPTVPVSAVEGRELARLIRESFAEIEPKADELAQYFYGALFVIAPDCRDMFPVTMASQRSRLLRALVYVVQMVDRPDELVTFLAQLGRDHRKFAVVTRHYDAVGIALLAALKRFLKQKWTHEVECAWTTAYGLIAKTMREAAQAETGPASWAARVLDHRRLSRDVAMVRVQTEGLLPYRAGSYVSVEVPQRPRMWRYLSPASAPRGDGQMTFHVRAVPGGWVSGTIVNHTKPGDVWRLGPAMGALNVRPTATRNRLLMIAGGTGVTPFVSILDDLAHWKRNPPVHLFFGGRRPEDLYALDDLRRLTAVSKWLTVTPVTEEGAVLGGDRGTLAHAVTQRGAWKDHDVLVSGSPEMIRATIAKLLTAGVELERIRFDPFTMD
ncbi:globin domain-containing protein [Amycolatopsis kentuckyensis]|uniref:globin domain-containing protein n=1 Tax=Amycolatopsis kentuckyensis TaxID=218823 RepID=UPI0035673ACE